MARSSNRGTVGLRLDPTVELLFQGAQTHPGDLRAGLPVLRRHGLAHQYLEIGRVPLWVLTNLDASR